ncbi:MAG: hypothetical protein A4E30_01605 [Methanomassiliicoccales archaeon PtaB.Bin215]|nr:MAG: hypothetical protein A4E30_01605 [Methanomassiliicoccales archaeon PtaB.Bin215]
MVQLWIVIPSHWLMYVFPRVQLTTLTSLDASMSRLSFSNSWYACTLSSSNPVTFFMTMSGGDPSSLVSCTWMSRNLRARVVLHTQMAGEESSPCRVNPWTRYGSDAVPVPGHRFDKACVCRSVSFSTLTF